MWAYITESILQRTRYSVVVKSQMFNVAPFCKTLAGSAGAWIAQPIESCFATTTASRLAWPELGTAFRRSSTVIFKSRFHTVPIVSVSKPVVSVANAPGLGLWQQRNAA